MMVQPDRRPAYLSAKTLARELDVSESQVYALVRGGTLPKPIKLSPGCVRWSWAKVQAALYALRHPTIPTWKAYRYPFDRPTHPSAAYLRISMLVD